MKTHKKTRIILIIIAALVAIFSSIAIITTTANKNNANAAGSVGSGGAVIKGGTHGTVGTGNKEPDVWWYGDEDASYAGINNVFSNTYKNNDYGTNVTEWTGWGISSTWNGIIKDAKNNCADRNKINGGNGSCEDPRLVALGWAQFSGSLGGTYGGHTTCYLTNVKIGITACPEGGSGTLDDIPTDFCTQYDNVQGNSINLSTPIGNTDTSICGAITGINYKNKTIVAVVLSKDEYQQTGWRPTFKPVDTYAYTSRIKISSQKLTPCPYEYTMQAVGVDGYVKNYATTQHTYKTAYGKFLDDVANGKHNGSYYYVGSGKKADFSNSPQEYQNNDLINDYNQSCQEAWNEVDNYNIESEAKSSKEVDDTTKKNIISGKEFLQRYAKGGIYKVIRGRLDGNINYRTTDVKYYKTKASYYIFDDWVSCKKTDNPTTDPDGKQINCDYIGKDKPSDKDNPYLGKKYKITHEGWGDPLSAQDGWAFYDDHPSTIVEDKWKNIKDGKDRDGKEGDLLLYDSGYYDENGQLHEKDNLIAKTPTEWNDYFYEFAYGFEGDDISPRLHPVKQEYKSWNHVWHQDFMNILCDKTDFDNYKTALEHIYGTYIYTDISKVSNGSKYQGQLKSPIIDNNFANEHNRAEVDKTWHKNGEKDGMEDHNNDNWYSNSGADWFYKWNIAASQVAATMEPFDRVLYTVSTPVGSDNKLDMANAFTNIKSVVGDTSADTLLAKAKSVNSAYNTDNFIRWYNSAAYDASLDPVYTKECPYDCTSNSKGYAGGAHYNIVDGSTSDGASDNAYLLKRNIGEGSTSDYGVRVRTTDSKGNLKPSTEDVNTANMTFFRNNAWSRFRVDLWYPVLDNGLTEAKPTDSIAGISETKGSQTAKSTTIIRNNGTPWYVKGTDSSSGFATEMKAIKSIDDGESPDNAKGLLFNPETNVITPGNQISLGSVTARGANVVELPGEQTAFAIRSMWATDSNIGKLEFNIKWEFDSKNNLDVPTKFTVGNTADSVSSTSTPQYAISDGKCYARNSYNERIDEKNLINLFHDNTGAGTIDNLDKEFSDNFGKFTIQFVRATAE